MRPTCSVAHLNRIPLRIDETNSVSCGGVAGVSDTFASALWATSYITQAMAAGAAGINLEGNPANCAGYTPLCAPDPTALLEGRLRAQPEWYALLLTRSLVGDRPLPTTIATEGATTEGSTTENTTTEGSTTEGSPNLVAASFSEPDHSLKVVLVDDEPQGTSPLALRLDVGAGLGAAQILRLTAPSPSATGDVLLVGRAVATNGSLGSPAAKENVAVHSGILALELPPASAMLITVSRPSPAPRASPRPSAKTRIDRSPRSDRSPARSPRKLA